MKITCGIRFNALYTLNSINTRDLQIDSIIYRYAIKQPPEPSLRYKTCEIIHIWKDRHEVWQDFDKCTSCKHSLKLIARRCFEKSYESI